MEKAPIRVAVTGGSGQINYSLLFRIASGELLGENHPVSLHILELPDAMDALKGVAMELSDCAFPMLREVRLSSDPKEVFEQADIVILVGAKPRGPGMERKDLLRENGAIFVEQGKALNAVASREALVFVVGNPCNTNCLITMAHAPDLNPRNFYAMTRLDENRARFQLAAKARVDLREVEYVTIWGNHSSTQVPDTYNVRIQGHPVQDILDTKWLQGPFIETVQKRGGAIIKARGKSSAASAANAIIDGIHSLRNIDEKGAFFSTAILSDGNPYGIADGIIFSFPCRATKGGGVEIIPDLEWDDFMKDKIRATEQELLEERDMVADLLKK